MTEGEGLFFGTLWGLGVAGILDYFQIDWQGLIIMTVFLILDFLFWLASAKSRWEKIESKKAQKWLVKKCTRWVLPFIVAWGIARLELPWVHGLITTIMGIIIFSELYSIIWHIYSINYWEALPEMDAFKIMMSKLSERIRNITKNKIDTLPKEEDSQDRQQDENKTD